MKVFNFVLDSQEGHLALGVFVGERSDGNFYLSLSWNNLLLEALLVELDTSVAIVKYSL